MGAIHKAVNAGNLEEVKRLIAEDPAVVHKLDALSWPPLHCASYSGHPEVVAYLLDHGARIDQQEMTSKRTALYLAAVAGHPPVIHLLLDRGADTNIPMEDKNTPLMAAAFKNQPSAVRAFLLRGSFVDSQNNNGMTALWIASNRGHTEAARLLLAAGADPTIRDYIDDLTCASIAKNKGNQDIINLLEGWDRSYLLVKTRTMIDAYRGYAVWLSNLGSNAGCCSVKSLMSGSSSSSGGGGRSSSSSSSTRISGSSSSSSSSCRGASRKRARMGKEVAVEATPFEARMGCWQELPLVEIADTCADEEMLHVVRYVTQDMKGALFAELMEFMGVTS